MAAESLIIASVDAPIHRARIDAQALTPRLMEVEPLADLGWDSALWTLHGAVPSRGGVCVVCAVSPGVHYCRLALRAPLRVRWMCVESWVRISDALLSPVAESLGAVSDALACLQAHLAENKPWPQHLLPLLQLTGPQRASASTHHLRLVRYLLRLRKLYLTKPRQVLPKKLLESVKISSDTDAVQELDSDKLLEENEQPMETVEHGESCSKDVEPVEQESLEQRLITIEDEIMRRHIIRTLNELMAIPSVHLTNQELHILRLMISQQRCGHKSIVDVAVSNRADAFMLRHLPKGQPDLDLTEVCIICQCPVPLMNYGADSCPNGHRFKRCCQTLSLCSKVPYRTCSVCSEFALAISAAGDTEDEQQSSGQLLRMLQTPYCTLCGSLLV